MENENYYEKYAVIDAQIRVLSNQKDELRVKLLEELLSRDEKSVVTAVGKFTVAQTKVWTYSDKIAELDEEFKAHKAKEQSTGEATFEENSSLRFTPIKL